ncbi:MAG: DUF4139 domain-containing protein [Deltaproteobacteria bacterium]|nr:DUF4139 domain-containing protein [Deltaproteobacteria bacterium]
MKKSLLFLTIVVFTLYGCPKNPDVAVEGLPIKKAVIYRNGVGYFEREGEPDSQKVYFRVRTNKVSDFLASLAILQEGGTSIKGISFPTKIEEEPVICPPKVKPEKCKELQKKSGLMKVTLELAEGYEKIRVGYITETPLWRPSYRIVQEGKKLYLQSWGIVQNISGEDWKNIRLSLVAGSPISFETNLAYTYIPQRPMISDYGEVISSVPQSETTLAEEPPMASETELYANGRSYDIPQSMPSKSMASPITTPTTKEAKAKSKKKAPPRREDTISTNDKAEPSTSMIPKDNIQLASVVVEGGQTRYDIPQRVTIPDNNSTMVLIFSKKVDGELSYLFAPEYGVPDSSSHPFRVVRFKNTTGGLLEKGPLAIYEDGSFLGQGILNMLPANATTTVPFSLERGIALEVKKNSIERGGRLYKIEAGEIMIERDLVYQTEYKIKNGLDKSINIIIKHQRNANSRITEPNKGVEDNVGTNTALIKKDIEGFTTDILKVEEVKSYPQSVDWMSDIAEEAIKDYIQNNKSDTGNVKLLSQLLEIRDQLKKSYIKRDKLYQEQNELEKAQNETRANLKAIEKNPQASDLKMKLTERLDKNASRLQIISKDLIEIQMRISELKVRFDETKKQIKILEPEEINVGL